MYFINDLIRNILALYLFDYMGFSPLVYLLADLRCMFVSFWLFFV